LNPELSEYVPVGQGRHSVTVVDLVVFPHVPNGHKEQPMLPSVSVKEPTVQFLQEAMEVAPTSDDAVPFGHLEQIESPALEYVPFGQDVHEVLPDPEIVPAGHVWQIDEVFAPETVEKVPGAQL
jgi:hypothetical protein